MQMLASGDGKERVETLERSSLAEVKAVSAFGIQSRLDRGADGVEEKRTAGDEVVVIINHPQEEVDTRNECNTYIDSRCRK